MKRLKRKNNDNILSNKTLKKSNSDNNVNRQLPIYHYQQQLINNIITKQVTILCGETGSGKSTQLPQYLLSSINKTRLPEGCIVCTQPRRVAAMTIAQHVANERRVTLGQEVGYSIRFDDKSCEKTKIKYVTDGVLLREIMSDRELLKYNVVILDEAHERSLQTDILIGLLKQLLEKRSSLRVVVMSATLEVNLFATYFNVNPSDVIHIKGRQYPVQIMYTPTPEPDFIEACLLTCLQIHEEDNFTQSSSGGGVLVFLSGQEDIENLQVLLEEHLRAMYNAKCESNKMKQSSVSAEKIDDNTSTILENNFEVDNGKNGKIVKFGDNMSDSDYIILPLYASMNPDDQLKAFQPRYAGKRKFILATNIAETSVTIPGIQYVVDPGKVKSRCMHEITGADMLQVDFVTEYNFVGIVNLEFTSLTKIYFVKS